MQDTPPFSCLYRPQARGTNRRMTFTGHELSTCYYGPKTLSRIPLGISQHLFCASLLQFERLFGKRCRIFLQSLNSPNGLFNPSRPQSQSQFIVATIPHCLQRPKSFSILKMRRIPAKARKKDVLSAGVFLYQCVKTCPEVEHWP